MEGKGFGFNRNNGGLDSSVGEGLVYKPYMEKFVRIDLAGGIGATGVLRAVDRYGHGGHALHLNPYIYFEPNNNPRAVNEDMMLLSTNSPSSISHLPYSIEEYVSKLTEENSLRRKNLRGKKGKNS